MIQKLVNLDLWCIGFIERNFCHKIQLLIGINNFGIAKLLILISALLGVASQGRFTVFHSLFLTTLEIAIRVYITINAERLTKTTHHVGFINPIQSIRVFSYGRIYFIGDALFQLFQHRSGYALISLSVWFFYAVVSCTPLPSTGSKIKEFFKNLVPSKTASAPTKS